MGVTRDGTLKVKLDSYGCQKQVQFNHQDTQGYYWWDGVWGG